MNCIEVSSDSSSSDNSDLTSILNKYKVYNTEDKQLSDKNFTSTSSNKSEFSNVCADTDITQEYNKSPIIGIDCAYQHLLNKYNTRKEEYKENKHDKFSKRTEKESKRVVIESEKQIKTFISEAHKNLKPEECLKNITVHIDSELINEEYGGAILTFLQSKSIKYKIESHLVPRSISWIRKVQTHSINEYGKLTSSYNSDDTTWVLLLKNWKEVIELVHSNSLVSHIQSIQNVFTDKHIFLAIYGLQNYFKFQKAAADKHLQGTKSKKQRIDELYEDVPVISRKKTKFALTELQLICCCCHRFVENEQDVGNMFLQFTKSIAQIPYKLEKNQKYNQAAWYMQGDNKGCVRVDKQNFGLTRLWQQQLTSFPLASLETAEAIILQYPTPNSLMEAYERCQSIAESEQLLQDVPIRRAAGPLTSIKKIGPELSKKIHNFFTGTSIDIL